MKYSPVTHYVTRRFRKVPVYKVYINKNTPIGDSADIWEIKPYGGRKLIDVIGEIREDNTFSLNIILMTKEIQDRIIEFMKSNNLSESDDLWHDGWMLRKGIACWLEQDKSREDR